ncbi:hypothetical protein [Flavilitoribacter nigricans]|uniref:Effector-associated domain-containing protein n=1 Tax=Flavilitoribacter nigricans (strain ATCC 23147 / DSM 23189 / NBRC 102662 / NCIMB 1420 / SS-2) TaxID=1122177 RepID=A0A2D0NCU3_FLAN2|nr:hypothetical protein [Flavilitoribacter nigricans]PHN05999.1 hypothetical protein CRP01_13600 [Flavilitoribacter nigricans DSM 23189 = NBRC 102662]
MDQEKYSAIEQALQEGSLSEALSLLVKATRDEEKSIREDAALLQSKFEYNRNQYEIKGVLTDQEFNIHYSKTTLAIQDILDRVRRGPGASGSAKSVQKSNLRPLLWLAGIAALIIAGWLLWPTPPEPTAESDQLADSTTVELPTEQNAEAGTIKEPILEPETDNTPSKPATQPPQMSTEVASEVDKAAAAVVKETEKAAAPPPAKTFKVNITRNSNMSDAAIYVDGERATILNSTLVVTTIRVTEKSGMHVFELRKAGGNNDCKKELLITEDNQRINFTCQ